ncbi:MAG: DUF308 domain-containing protein [Chloroflexota bacterium]|nr:MAG: DUF308 domain-containing protein [Chloroflexota bacterium]
MAEFLEKTWWIALLRGLIAILFGIFALVNPEGAGSLLVLVFGIFLVVDGLVNLIGSILYYRVAVDWWVYLVIGMLEIGVALITFMRPEITGTILAILVGLWALFKGLIELMAGIALRDEVEGEWILILTGVLTLVFGVFALLLPFTESVAAIWMLGLYAFLNGTLWVVIGFEARSLSKELVEVE